MTLCQTLWVTLPALPQSSCRSYRALDKAHFCLATGSLGHVTAPVLQGCCNCSPCQAGVAAAVQAEEHCAAGTCHVHPVGSRDKSRRQCDGFARCTTG